MTRTISATSIFAVLVLIAGCATGGATGVDRYLITEERIQGSSANAVDQFLEWEEPQWIRNSATRVFVDGTDWGTADVLTDIPLSNVREIRYWPPRRAEARFGAGHSAGVLEITRR